ncbi:MAG: RICIN domain-containing protein [Methylomicrobium sp.]|nr:RICIN domain-containing protein [Methylomicrobium sp.]
MSQSTNRFAYSEPRAVSLSKGWGASLLAGSAISLVLWALPAASQALEAPIVEGLKGVRVPEPSNINQFIANKAAAIRLGKALFWDTQVGSDGKTSCASCHFHAGADNRTVNQISPGLLRVTSPGNSNPDLSFTLGGPNYQLKRDDFPFHKFADANNRHSAVVRTHNDASSSQGVFKSIFVSAAPGARQDDFFLAGDNVFLKDDLQTRQVEPRNSPTVINSIFNFRNFWDGRATYLFNGASPFGPLDTQAKVYKTSILSNAWISPLTVRIDNASLASLSTGPALSDFEMSAAGRTWPNIGVRLLPARALAFQTISPTDSVLDSIRHPTDPGSNNTYNNLVETAFRPEWWNSTASVTINGASYTQKQANFSMYFGLALQMYMATLVSDDSPFDKLMAGQPVNYPQDATAGMAIFFGKGKCASCHSGAEFTAASTRKVLKTPLSRMIMGDGSTAVYDEGFYNIAITETLEDIANGANNPVNKPVSLSRLAQQMGPFEFQRLVGIPANLTVWPNERIAINGAFKTPTIRNVELTAPYFHDGSILTLEQVVDFYNRGGNHFQNNLQDVDADIEPLGLTAIERTQLVAFMKSLTDERVRFNRAPFDHPQLIDLPNGHKLDANGLTIPFEGRALVAATSIPAVGREGLNVPPPNFQEKLASTTQYVYLKFAHSGKCLDVSEISFNSGANVYQWDCHGGNNQKWIQIDAEGGFMLRSMHSNMCLDVSEISTRPGANVYQWHCHGGDNQLFNWVGNRLVAKHSNQCLNVAGAGLQNSANVLQWPCTNDALNDQLVKFSTPEIPVFNLVAEHSGRCVDVDAAGQQDGTNIHQWDCVAGALNEQWQEVPTAGGFLLKASHSGKCMSVGGNSHTAGANVHQQTCNLNDANQKLSWLGNRLQFKSSGQCLNVVGAYLQNGANIVQWPCTESNRNDQFIKR